MFQWFKKSARLPVAGARLYAIGDIHGRSDLLEHLLGLILQENPEPAGPFALVFVGDYVDRGPDSRGVVDLLVDLQHRVSCHFLRGNHDQALLDFLNEPASYRTWRDYGAAETLVSYEVPPPRSDDIQDLLKARAELVNRMPFEHRRFFEDLQLSFERDGYFFVHAGIRPGVPLALQAPTDLMWIRDEFLPGDHGHEHGRIIVHGHTPAAAPVFKGCRIGVDTGAYYSGRLTAAVLESGKLRFLQT